MRGDAIALDTTRAIDVLNDLDDCEETGNR